MRLTRIFIFILTALAISACSTKEVTPEGNINSLPPIYPDYTDVTVAPNLVAPRFWVPDSCGIEGLQAVFTSGGLTTVIDCKGRQVKISERRWHQLIDESDTVSVKLIVKKAGKWLAYKPFNIYIAKEPIDAFIAYRLIEPGYESWNEMGIYQRSLESYREEPIITNKQTDYGCMNCHSFCQQNPDMMLMHLRKEHGGTYTIIDGEITKLNTKTPETISALVYPYWHPSGKYVAFSVNDTKQMFHTTDPNRIEVYDNASDVVVYDVDKHEIISTPLIMSDAAFETFPTFSPDGRTLYFCSADTVAMPASYDKLKYNICSISFDPDARKFGTEVDTLFNAAEWDKSASFPRVSPDGRQLMFTLSDYGTFSIWHRDADLYMADLADGKIRPLDILNSNETESYHSWSHDGHWVVFSSRRLDGLYTRPYIAYVDDQGNVHKPLLLPIPTEDYYERLMQSYNVPEFITDYVRVSGYDISQTAKNSKGVDVKMSR